MGAFSEHFEDFAPSLWKAPPATYPDTYQEGTQGRWFVSSAGVLWTDDKTRLGLDTEDATDWTLVARVRTGLVESFAEVIPATRAFSELQAEIDPDEWSEGDLGGWLSQA